MERSNRVVERMSKERLDELRKYISGDWGPNSIEVALGLIEEALIEIDRAQASEDELTAKDKRVQVALTPIAKKTLWPEGEVDR